MTTWMRSVVSGLESKGGVRETPEELMARWAKEDAERKARRSVRAECPSCEGDGFGQMGGNCPTCNGSGRV